jgi:hypothetical protein
MPLVCSGPENLRCHLAWIAVGPQAVQYPCYNMSTNTKPALAWLARGRASAVCAHGAWLF